MEYKRTVRFIRASDGSVGLRFLRPDRRTDGPCEVTSLVKGGAAEHSGLIRPGDAICAVDGTDLSQLDDHSISALFRGRPWAEIELSLCRSTDAELSSPTCAKESRIDRDASIVDVSTTLAWISSKLAPSHLADFEALAALLQSVALLPETVSLPLVSCTSLLPSCPAIGLSPSLRRSEKAM